ncbi:MAG: DUF6958 family protein [Saprospiraceae bacterium]
MDNRIMTKHPQGKKGVNILQSKYEFIKNAILDQLKGVEEMSYQELTNILERKLKDEFDGKVAWYVVSVKLDLEARGIIMRVPKSKPHRLRII